MDLRVHGYGSSGARLAVLHGGPGAPGSAAPLARALATSFRVLEPWQRGAGAEPLTVARHIADLHAVIAKCAETPVGLVGHSWGAMLALAYAAEHPHRVGALALIGCGTFDSQARAALRANREERMDAALRRRLEHLRALPDTDERLQSLGELFAGLDSLAPSGWEDTFAHCDARAHRESWADMLRLQEAGIFPAAFAAIDAPVLLLHGAFDPHPGRLIAESLQPYLPRLEYRELERCGHYPWLERDAREDFLTALRAWLARQLGAQAPRRGPR